MLFQAGLSARGRCAALVLCLVSSLLALLPFSALAAKSVTLVWSPSTDPNIASYNVYYGAASHSYTNLISAGNATNATISDLVEGVTYYFAATAVDNAGLESDYSNEATNYPANQPPWISSIADQTTLQDTPTLPISFTIGDVETAASNLSLRANSDNPALVAINNIVFGGSDSNRTVTLTPTSQQTGSAGITITVDDGNATSSATFRLSVTAPTPANTPPSISPIANQTIDQDTATPAIPFTVSDAESAAASLTISATSTNTSLLPTTNIVFGGSDTNRTVTLTPVAGQTGEADVTITVSDGAALSATTLHLTVLPVVPTSPTNVVLMVAGNGTITPNVSIQQPTLGRSYTITAVAAPGQAFAGWSGSTNSLSTALSFVMKPHLLFKANFVPITIVTNGRGSIFPNLAASRSLVIGRTYSISAIPAPGQVFAGWTGTMTSSVPKLTFRMTSNIVVQANFIPSPYIAAQGSYNGLFYEQDAIRPGHAGSINVSATSAGAYSGSLLLGATRLNFSGKFDLQCQGTNVLRSGGTNRLTLELHLGSGDQADHLFGRLTDGNWVSALTGDRAVFNSSNNPAPYKGSYTMVLPGEDGDPLVPAGDGYGTVQVSRNGMAAFVGALADGSRVAQSVPVSRQGLWPVYIPLYSGRGCVMSWLAFTNQLYDDFNGLLSWIKPAISNAQYYPAGFTNSCQAVGSVYLPPAGATNSVLNLTNASVVFSGGNLASDFTNCVRLGMSSQIINLSTNRLTFKFALSSGTFQGNVSDPVSGRSLYLSGAVFQKRNAAYGFLLGNSQSSRVSLTP